MDWEPFSPPPGLAPPTELEPVTVSPIDVDVLAGVQWSSVLHAGAQRIAKVTKQARPPELPRSVV